MVLEYGRWHPTLDKGQQSRHPDFIHPVVRVHHRKGRNVLYVEGYTVKINGMSEDESDTLLE